jgi:hypothetical protein
LQFQVTRVERNRPQLLLQSDSFVHIQDVGCCISRPPFAVFRHKPIPLPKAL